MPSLFSEKNTVFAHTLWDRYEYVTLLRQQRKLNDMDVYQREHYNYSLQQDGFYALHGVGLVPDSANPTVQFWQAVQRTPWFKQLQKVFKQDAVGRRVAVKHLAQITNGYVVDSDPQHAADQRQAQQEIEQIRQALEQAYQQDQAQDDDQDQGQGDDSAQGQGQDDADQQDSNSSSGENENGAPQESVSPGESAQTTAAASSGGQHPAAQSPLGADQGQAGNRPHAPTHTGVGRATGRAAAQSRVPLGPVSPLPGLPQNLKFTDPVEHPRSGEPAQAAEQEHTAINGLLPYLRPEQRQDTRLLNDLDKLVGKLDVAKIAKLLGFAQRAVAGAHHTADATGGELTQYRNTTWSEKLHPVDLAGLARGDVRTRARLAEGGLRERRYENKAPRGRGPVVVLRDETGSMSGDKHDSARALEIALAHAFNQDNRDLVSIAWGGSAVRTCTYGQDDVLAHLTTYISGNYTKIEQGLREASRMARDYRDGADILILSDGTIEDAQYHSVKAMAESFHQANGRIWVVLICTESDIYWMENAAGSTDLRGNRQKGTVQAYLDWADGVIHLDDLSSSEKLGKLIQTMNRKEINLKGKKVAV